MTERCRRVWTGFKTDLGSNRYEFNAESQQTLPGDFSNELVETPLDPTEEYGSSV